MPTTKVSLITVCYNAASTIERCIQSVINQQLPELEYIIIDGGSTDGTIEIINGYVNSISKIISEPDGGIYHAMNKGIALATGKIVGVLNADDCFAANDILQSVVDVFVSNNCQMLYGDIDFVNSAGKVTRRWRSGNYQQGAFNFGWMPPHPSFYMLKEIYDTYGLYSYDYGTAADYELMARLIHRHKLKLCYLPKLMVHMQSGGVSNGNLSKRTSAWGNDYKAMKVNGIAFPIFALFMKPLRKVKQYLAR